MPYTCGFKIILYIILTAPAFWLQATTRRELSIYEVMPALKVSDFKQFRSRKFLHCGCKIAYTCHLCHLLPVCRTYRERNASMSQTRHGSHSQSLAETKVHQENPTQECVITPERRPLMERNRDMVWLSGQTILGKWHLAWDLKGK